MNKSYIVAGIAIIVIVVIFGFIYLSGNRQSSQFALSVAQAPASPGQIPSGAQSPPANDAALPAAVTVTYTDSGFSPSAVTISKGGAMIFKNSASDAMWVASNPHPAHNGYPTTGGCAGSTFDACRSISSGGSWSFVFDSIGAWRYHNHLNPSAGGTVVVQ